jgi:hypothetical protein
LSLSSFRIVALNIFDSQEVRSRISLQSSEGLTLDIYAPTLAVKKKSFVTFFFSDVTFYIFDIQELQSTIALPENNTLAYFFHHPWQRKNGFGIFFFSDVAFYIFDNQVFHSRITL